MISLYRRNRIFWVRSCCGGREHRRSLRTRDQQTARALLRQLELDEMSGGAFKRVYWPEFETEFLRWIESQVRPSTVRGYRLLAVRFGRFLHSEGTFDLRQITPSVVSKFCEVRKQDIHPLRKRPMSDGGIRLTSGFFTGFSASQSSAGMSLQTRSACVTSTQFRARQCHSARTRLRRCWRTRKAIHNSELSSLRFCFAASASAT